MKKLALIAMTMALACAPIAKVVTQNSALPELAFCPTANKKTAKRQRRKAQRRSEDAAKYINDKPYRERNKKGRP
jgi:hypothetical protein